MKLDPVLPLHEVVEEDEENGRSTFKISDYYSSFIDYCSLPNHMAWTAVRISNRTVMRVKESPDEIWSLIRRLARSDERDLRKGSRSQLESPKFHVYQDVDKCVLINMDRVKAIQPISKFQTKFTFHGDSTLIVSLPLDLLDLGPRRTKAAQATKE